MCESPTVKNHKANWSDDLDVQQADGFPAREEGDTPQKRRVATPMPRGMLYHRNDTAPGAR